MSFQNIFNIITLVIILTIIFIFANFFYYKIFFSDYEKKENIFLIEFNFDFDLSNNFKLIKSDHMKIFDDLTSSEGFIYNSSGNIKELKFISYDKEDKTSDIKKLISHIIDEYNKIDYSLPSTPVNSIKEFNFCMKLFDNEGFCLPFFKSNLLGEINGMQSEYHVQEYLLSPFDTYEATMDFFDRFYSLLTKKVEETPKLELLKFTSDQKIIFKFNFYKFLFKNLIVYFSFLSLFIITFIFYRFNSKKNNNNS